jgi:hypothetical protein
MNKSNDKESLKLCLKDSTTLKYNEANFNSYSGK